MLFKTLSLVSYLNVRFPFPHETVVVASNQFQVMIDFQGAERKTLEEPASEIGLEALCAMVCQECRFKVLPPSPINWHRLTWHGF